MPESLRGLILASDEEEAAQYYWQLENVVVVQGQLFEAAPAAVSVIMAALADELSSASRGWCLELLFQLVSGESNQEAVGRGNLDLGERCRANAREGLWLLYAEMARGKFDGAAQQVIQVLEHDKDRFNAFCQRPSGE
ncbi:MAG: hypothetical protein ACJ73S_07925 [Mycobacteriales bacterium]